VDEITTAVRRIIDDIQENLYNRALAFREENTLKTENFDEFKKIFEGEGGFIHASWCGNAECEAKIKEETKATIRVLLEDDGAEADVCILCNKKAEYRAVFAKAY
ncbi:MAG: proline--tRNA ligase, partial [Spirochaetota bacterium]